MGRSAGAGRFGRKNAHRVRPISTTRKRATHNRRFREKNRQKFGQLAEGLRFSSHSCRGVTHWAELLTNVELQVARVFPRSQPIILYAHMSPPRVPVETARVTRWVGECSS